MEFPLKCPHCSCELFRISNPHWKRKFTAPLTDQVHILINLLTDPEFKEPDEPVQLVFFTCTQCEWSFLKAEGATLQEAFARAQAK